MITDKAIDKGIEDNRIREIAKSVYPSTKKGEAEINPGPKSSNNGLEYKLGRIHDNSRSLERNIGGMRMTVLQFENGNEELIGNDNKRAGTQRLQGRGKGGNLNSENPNLHCSSTD
ncbi:hypothetical protein SOVF_001430 [Spinacia oleracea]|nr:hypothetical protein SOVF_001430 [Spinacia oleracea]